MKKYYSIFFLAWMVLGGYILISNFNDRSNSQKVERMFLSEINNRMGNYIIKVNNYGRVSSYIDIEMNYGWNIYVDELNQMGFKKINGNIYCLNHQEVELFLHKSHTSLMYRYPSDRC